jgi:exopolyphosphatase / guanosine-5'-triphosphate,3'-diphosphate pyrophosphatase
VTPRPPIGASVDLGSNSVHLLVAVIAGHRLRPLTDESVFLGLGAAVDAQAHLGPAGRDELVAALSRYASTARALGAASITFMGTEPIRRAGDAARIAADVEASTGIPLHVLTHEEEAYLTLIGVTAGRPVQHETLVVDIGGGSSEFCAVAAGGVARAAGIRLGSGRLTSRFVTSDPVDAAAIELMQAAADETLEDALAAAPTDLVAVGGTASNLLKVTTGGVEDQMLTRERIAQALGTLSSTPTDALTERFFINPKRGPLLAAGAVIVDALMRHYDVEAVRVSDAGLREGAILVADHVGRAWRDRLPELAHGWRQ